jgi:hypothetical protein
MAKVFISYAHGEQWWVLDRLVPVLEAGGAGIIIDVRQFHAGRSVAGQMDHWQDQADRQLLVISANALASGPCRHEMQRAIGRDPDFTGGVVVPIRRDDTPLPSRLTAPLFVDLRDDRVAGPWDALLAACDARLGVPAPHWLEKRDRIVRLLNDRRSVNLVVGAGVPWQPLVRHLGTLDGLALAEIDLESWGVASRPALLQTVLHGLGSRRALPDRPHDLLEFGREIEARPFSRIALVHFDMVGHHSDYSQDVELFAALRHLINTQRKLALLVQSRAPFQSLLPRTHPLSEIDMTTVTLSATP